MKSSTATLIRKLCGVSSDSANRKYTKDGRGTIRVAGNRRSLKREFYATPRRQRAALVAGWRRRLEAMSGPAHS